MARGELMKKLLASYGRDEEFRAVAEQIIGEEEKKNNRVLARSLRKSLEAGPSPRSKPRGLAPLIPFPESAGDFIELVEPSHNKQDIVLSSENVRIFLSLLREYRRGDEIRRRGLPVRSKLLFCGPPGCGKTLCAEVFAAELGLPLYIVKIDRLISSYLGETATNIRKIFEFARKQPTVLFFDEFDALARARSEDGEHSELRRVVNSLLIFIDRIQPKGFLVAATNFDQSLDSAIFRCIFSTLSYSVTFMGVPRPCLLDDTLLYSELQNLTRSVNTSSVQNLKFSLPKRRRDFIFHHFHPGFVANDFIALFHGTNSPYIESYGGVKLQRITTRSGFGRAEHHTDFHSDLIDKNHHGVGLFYVASHFSQRLTHEPSLQSNMRVPHIALDFRSGR